MAKKKRYFFSVIEEGIKDTKYKSFRRGRIEVYDSKSKNDYAIYEAKFLVPMKFMNSFRKVWDFKESDEMPFIHWDYDESKIEQP